MKMKLTRPTNFISLLLFGLLASSARAGIVLQDNFDSYATGDLVSVSGGLWATHSGTTPMNVVADTSVSAPNALQVTRSASEDDNAALTNAPYYGAGTNAAGDAVTALYFKFTIRMSSADLPTASGTYFAHLKDTTTSGFRARTFVATAGAAAGFYRVGIENAGLSGAVPAYLTTDLAPDTTYVIVVRYVVTNGVATLWVNPTSESDPSVTGTDTTSLLDISTMAFRQSSGEGTLNVDDLVVGTSFADILSGRPLVVQEPQDTVSFNSATVTFNMAAFGAQPMSYQWYYKTNTLVDNLTFPGSGAASNVLVLTNLAIGESGTYSCVASNAAGTNITRYALLTVYSAPISPVITNQPAAGSTNIIGDDVTFSVVAGGVPPPAYQWKVIANGVTNSVTGANVSGADSDTLILTGMTTNQTGVYFVTITNVVGTTNSSPATLLVKPSPLLNIADLRSMVDSGTLVPTNTTSIYIAEGIVTTWTNMTGSANCSFYMQDSTSGINVYWAGSPGANMPPAGADVRVTGRLSNFNGLIELVARVTDPQTSVEVISTNNPLPAPQPLPFDPTVMNNPAMMEKLEGTYFVATNVTFTAGSTLVGGANEFITNNAYHELSDNMFGLNFTNDVGQTFTLYVNYYTDVQNKPKYTGPVTIYGVLGSYKGQYQFTPSRYADIISYTSQSNVVSNVVRSGDLLTNNYIENKLLNGETLTARMSIGDPEGGMVTLAPATVGLPGDASWSDVTSGQTGTATLTFTPAGGDDGSNYVFTVGVSSTSGNLFSNSFTVYVPTADEQQIAISEFLANPTADTNAPNFNPLRRSTDTAGVSTNDQYIEIANESPHDMYLYGWAIYNTAGSKVQDFSLNGPTLSSSNAVVVYGGPANQSAPPSLVAYNEPATSKSLRLATTGIGTIVLRNQNGNIIDRVVYSGSDLNTNGSLARFPDNINGPFVSQPYISTNLTTPGLPYDGGVWTQPFKVPAGVSKVGISVVNGQVLFNFTANTGLASTLWGADTVNGPYNVLNGGQFQTTSGAFTNPTPAAIKFYYISTQ